MRRMICLLGVLLVCATLVCPALAADTFVPSIGYKDGPDVEDAQMGDTGVGDCVVVTSIAQAEDKSTDITQDARDLLLDVYKKLSDGSMKPPVEGYVIRELVDVNFKQTACVENDAHNHAEELAKDGTTIKVTFDLGVAKSTKVVVKTYTNGAWEDVVAVTNNGDGTVTVEFEHFCPVAFCVEQDAEVPPSQTGDEAGQNMFLWIALMVLSLAAIVVLVILGRKRSK